MKLKTLALAVSCIVMLTGCNTNDKSSAEVQAIKSTLVSNGYTIMSYGKMFDRALSQRDWVALCKDSHKKEYIVVLNPANKIVSSTQLGIDGRLTFEQMQKKLEGQGIDSINDLGAYLSKDNKVLYWHLRNQLYYLSGAPYQTLK